MRIRIIAALVALGAWSPVAAADCGVQLGGGVVKMAHVLPPALELESDDKACVGEAARRLLQRPGLRTVTVAVRLSDEERASGSGPKIGEAYKQALVAGGLPPAKVSSVSPAAGSGEAASVSITFSEKRGGSRVGIAEAVAGEVVAGGDLGGLAPLAAGAMIEAKTYVQTGPGSSVALGLADGSRLQIAADSVVLVGEVHLDEALKRVVKLELVSGSIDAHATSSGGNFEVSTRTAVAGVRGTSFRMTVSGEELTRLETTEGLVALGGSGGTVDVNGGQGSQVDSFGVPETPRALLPEPRVDSPLFGRTARSGNLTWRPVRGAVSYRVQIADDAEFTLARTELSVAEARLAMADDWPTSKRFWRVAAVDEDDFLGMWSRIYAFELEP